MNAAPALLEPPRCSEPPLLPCVKTGYQMGGADIRNAFLRTGAYPLRLSPQRAHPGAVELFIHWLDATGQRFLAADQPWLPVGRLGPLLVLGHSDVRQRAPIPHDWFQPVILREDEYDAHLRVCADFIAQLPRPTWDGVQWIAPRRLCPDAGMRLIRPTTFRAALQFLLEYFPHRRGDLERVRQRLDVADAPEPDGLPFGYASACWLLSQRGAVADPTLVAAPEQLVHRMPSGVANRVHVLSEHDKNVWIGTAEVPNPQLEDLLLNELGDGWYVHFVHCEKRPLSPEAGGSGSVASASETDPGHGGRTRIRIDDGRARSRAPFSPEPGVIRISAKDIRELESYNTKRPDRDPLRVFLKELSAGIRHGATDLHIEAGLESYRVRARIDGCLEEWLEMPLAFGKMVVGAAKEQFGMPPERWAPQDGNCTVHHGAEVVNLRVAAYPIRAAGQKLAIRYLPRRGDVPKLDRLMPAAQAATLRRAITRPYGLILLCGPTGSGKTTTTFSALAEINRPDVNITTMEDPVEYEMDGVNQAELDRPRGVDWDILVSGFLRQDPDIGMVGEIRDRQTAETAIRLTLTGHIVFATLHTMSCAHTVERLVDSGVNAQMFANAATLIVSQRLVRRLCHHCKQAGQRPVSDAEKELLQRHRIPAPASVIDAVNTGCPECRGTGYKGRVGAFEMLPVTEEVARMIADKRPVQAIEEWMRRHRQPSVYEAALALAARGETSLGEANEWQGVWEDYPIDRYQAEGVQHEH